MGQGIFESDDAYQQRMSQEANISRVEAATGEKPRQGLFEGDDSYASRISIEANRTEVERSGGDSNQGLFEGDSNYRNRLAQQANEWRIASATGDAPRQGLFESEESYGHRVRQEAHHTAVTLGDPNAARQGLLESDKSYRSRISLRARELASSGQVSVRPSSSVEFIASSGSGAGFKGKIAVPSNRRGHGGLIFLIGIALILWIAVEKLPSLTASYAGQGRYAQIAETLAGPPREQFAIFPDGSGRGRLSLYSINGKIHLNTQVIGRPACSISLSPSGLVGDDVELSLERDAGICNTSTLSAKIRRVDQDVILTIGLNGDQPWPMVINFQAS